MCIRDRAITLHIEPMSETVSQGFTIGYLAPALKAAGFEAEADEIMVWYDTYDLTIRPDRSADAVLVYDRIEISGAALRRETGMSEEDAPTDEERQERIMLKLATTDPMIAQELLGEYDRTEPAEPEGAPVEPPSTVPAEAATILEASEGLVHRALERAGMRLRSAAGRQMNGGAAAITCGDPTMLHVELDGALRYADADHLLANAWTRVPDVALRLGVDPVMLTATLDNYVRALLATGTPHEHGRLTEALGLQPTF